MMSSASATAVPLGLRQRKKDAARSDIAKNAVELFAKRGFDDVTVDEIADRAGVSRRTFFRYFPTKDAVVLERRREQLAELERLLAERPKTEPVRDVVLAVLSELARGYVEGRARILAERRLFAKSASLAVADIEVDRAFENALAKDVMRRMGSGPDERRRARVFAAALFAVIRVTIDEWAHDKEGAISLETSGREAAEQIFAILGPDSKTTQKRGGRA
jgi:AcrR family transcriptional regulator